MSGSGWGDWQETGWFPLQDHEPDVPLHIRQQIVGGRIHKVPDPADGDKGTETVPTYARDSSGLATLGDIHPWFFWQTQDRGMRGMGMWSMAHSGLAVTGGTGGFGKHTGHKVKPTGFEPFRLGHGADWRFSKRFPTWPESFPTIPQGVEMMIMPGTAEGVQSEHMLHADPRLVSSNVAGPGEAGTLVCDLQPNGVMCMDGAKYGPGMQGRAARLQTHMRVIAMRSSTPGLRVGRGNAIAWNLALTQQEEIAGYGMCWARLEGGGGAQPGPITQPTHMSPGGGGEGGPEGAGSGHPDEFGKFTPAAQANHGIGLMAQIGGSGPFTVGGAGDKHWINTDRDSNPINSGHLSTNAYFFMDGRRDAPLHFQRHEYPDPKPLPLFSRVHLVYDDDLDHPWVRGTRPGMWRWYAEYNVVVPKDTVPTVTFPPGGGGPGTPRVPVPTGPGPTTPGPVPPVPRGGGPGTGGPGFEPRAPVITPSRGSFDPGKTGQPDPGRGGGGGSSSGGRSIRNPDGYRPWYPGLPKGVFGGGTQTGGPEDYRGPPEGGGRRDTRWETGDTQPEDVALFQLFHPMMEGFAGMSFRPQFWAAGAPSYIHNSEMPADVTYADEEVRPQVLAMHAWGGVDSDADDWDYVKTPDTSRARGGTAHGGILFCPPHLEMEDYLAINSVENVRALSTVSYIMAAPYVGFALGTPHVSGGLAAKSVIIAQLPSGDEQVRIQQLDSDRVAQTLFEAEWDDTDNMAHVTISGTRGFTLPVGTDAQRPVATVATGDFRFNSDAGKVEVYDGSGWDQLTPATSTTWKNLADTAAAFGASGTMVYNNAGTLGFTSWTQAQVILSTGAVAMGANWSMGGNRITSVADSTAASDDAIPRSQIDSTANGEGASIVGIEDTGGYYTGTEVEAALQELGVDVGAIQVKTVNLGEAGDGWTNVEFDVGGQNITNVGTVDGVDVSAHAADTDIHWSKSTHESEDSHEIYIKEDGTRDFSGSQSLGGFNLTNIGKAVIGQSAVDANSILRIEGDNYAGGAATTADDIVSIEDATVAKINIICATTGALLFSDGTRDVANLSYDHSTNAMTLKSNGTTMVGITNAGIIMQAGVAATPDSDHVLDVRGNIVANGGASTTGTDRNGQMNVWVDQAFGHELHYDASGFAHALYGRNSDTDAIRFGTYAADATAQNTFTEEGVMSSAGLWGFGQATPAAHVHITQDNSSGAIPCLELDQDDVDEVFIEFDGTSSATGNSVVAYDTNADGLKCSVNGANAWVNAYDSEEIGSGAFARYAQIYVSAGSAAQSITTGGTFEKFTGWTTDGLSNDCTADSANDKITITKVGVYLVSVQLSFSGTANSDWDFRMQWNSADQPQLRCQRKLGAGGDVGSCSIVGLLDATSASADLELWMTSAANGHSMTAVDAQMNVTWLGST